MKARNNNKGQALIETAVAGIVIVPIFLLLLDLGILVHCNMTNDEAAKNAARAAANQPKESLANQAAQNAISNIKKSPIIWNLTIKDCKYVASESVTVKTQMEVNLPVPVPGMTKFVFVAQSVQPIVAE